ncbi:MAG TPA: nucleotidyltransferase domain-containing protein [Longimicrobiaceae bacterium]|nr:nucleotidyltransferase domain-containing protein [Longimicrobiaceae bacterium]
MLFNPLDGILGSTAKVRILRALLPLTVPVSGREAQKLAGVRSRRGAGTALDDLSDLGVLRRTETRGSHLYQVNPQHELVPPLTALFGKEEGRLRELVATIRAGLAERELAERVRSVVLYGSNARRDATPRSDVDLMAVVDSDLAVSAVREALYEVGQDLRRRLGLRISPHVLTMHRVRERAEDGDPFVQTIREEGRPLMGEALDGLLAPW